MTCVKRRIDASMLTMPQGHPDYRFVCQGDVAQDSGGSSGAERGGKIRRLAEVPFGALAVGDEEEFKKSAMQTKE